MGGAPWYSSPFPLTGPPWFRVVAVVPAVPFQPGGSIDVRVETTDDDPGRLPTWSDLGLPVHLEAGRSTAAAIEKPTVLVRFRLDQFGGDVWVEFPPGP